MHILCFKLSGLKAVVISKTFNKGGSKDNIMKRGVVYCDHAHIFIEFEYDNQCVRKPNRLKTMRKV